MPLRSYQASCVCRVLALILCRVAAFKHARPCVIYRAPPHPIPLSADHRIDGYRVIGVIPANTVNHLRFLLGFHKIRPQKSRFDCSLVILGWVLDRRRSQPNQTGNIKTALLAADLFTKEVSRSRPCIMAELRPASTVRFNSHRDLNQKPLSTAISFPCSPTRLSSN